MIVDLFAGPGGWDEALRTLGRTDVVGLEWDRHACTTAARAGHARIRADVATYPPERFAGVDGLIASPPCQLFSKAGGEHGTTAIDVLADAMGRLLAGDDVRADLRATIRPAILARLRDTEARKPADRRRTPDAVDAAAGRGAYIAALVVEPARWVHATEPRWVALEQVPAVLPLWHRLADHLRLAGYDAAAYKLVAADYGTPQVRTRAVLMAHRTAPVARPEPTHAADAPDAPSLFGLPRWVAMADAIDLDADVELVPGGGGLRNGRNGGPNRRPWPADGPAPTVAFGRDFSGWLWRRRDQSGPCPDPGWPARRPATTIAGRGLVPDPGANANRYNGATKSRNDGYRVALWEAGVLQGFPADYPWTGPAGAQAQQVGNAVPPQLAAAVLRALGADTPNRAHLTTVGQ